MDRSNSSRNGRTRALNLPGPSCRWTIFSPPSIAWSNCGPNRVRILPRLRRCRPVMSPLRARGYGVNLLKAVGPEPLVTPLGKGML